LLRERETATATPALPELGKANLPRNESGNGSTNDNASAAKHCEGNRGTDGETTVLGVGRCSDRIDAAIPMFDQTYNVKGIRQKIPAAAHRALRGDLTRATLDPLRDAPGPMTTKELARTSWPNLNTADAALLHYNGNAIDLRRHRTVTLDFPHIRSQLKPVPSHGGWPSSQARRRRHAMNIAHGLRRALQVNACATATIFAGRRRTWKEIGDGVSRFAGGVGAHRLGPQRLRCGPDAQPGSLNRVPPDRQLGAHRGRALNKEP
jgi:hypothetical protein